MPSDRRVIVRTVPISSGMIAVEKNRQFWATKQPCGWKFGNLHREAAMFSTDRGPQPDARICRNPMATERYGWSISSAGDRAVFGARVTCIVGQR
jgi:hypothetical protein